MGNLKAKTRRQEQDMVVDFRANQLNEISSSVERSNGGFLKIGKIESN